jgi:hypothetical protein
MFQHFLENVVTFFNENVEPTFFNQHFSEKSCINIFREKTLESTFFNIFSKCYNIFQGVINIFLPFFFLQTAAGGRRARQPTGGGGERKPGRGARSPPAMAVAVAGGGQHGGGVGRLGRGGGAG